MKKYLKLFCVGVLLSLALVFISLPIQAQHNLAQSSSSQSNPAETDTWWMRNGDSSKVAGFFFADELISGQCSRHCYDIDLTLYDASTGNAVAQALGNSPAPELRAPYDGEFILEVAMVNCARSGGCRTSVSSEYGL
ncbi:MAG: hypothetical protein AAFX01_00780 [Cyanobacteria bacterium J06638_28]